MNSGGKILVVDPMLPPGDEPHPNWLTDMIGLTITGGQCRTEAEFRNLFDDVGLTLVRVIATRSPNFILEAVRDRLWERVADRVAIELPPRQVLDG